MNETDHGVLKKRLQRQRISDIIRKNIAQINYFGKDMKAESFRQRNEDIRALQKK